MSKTSVNLLKLLYFCWLLRCDEEWIMLNSPLKKQHKSQCCGTPRAPLSKRFLVRMLCYIEPTSSNSNLLRQCQGGFNMLATLFWANPLPAHKQAQSKRRLAVIIVSRPGGPVIDPVNAAVMTRLATLSYHLFVSVAIYLLQLPFKCISCHIFGSAAMYFPQVSCICLSCMDLPQMTCICLR